MTPTTPSPGPWRLGSYGDSPILDTIYDANGELVMQIRLLRCMKPAEEIQANLELVLGAAGKPKRSTVKT